ncbi:MAG TPA: PQQ-binding-like beta-propeller repeat protein [Chitinophagaceae bacterium]|nr:PQQ-binding-like beta-propeller repeat protein [Chitinophagaceae bacterium]
MIRMLLSTLLLIGIFLVSHAQIKPFRFAFISDTHIGAAVNGLAEEDLRRTVRDINSMNDISFVVLTGDITELGTNTELKLAKQILDSLKVPYYIIPGNHDTGWSESGGYGFITTFGNDKFLFDHNGVRFIGCASGPYVRMSDGHVPRDAVLWLQKVLQQTPADRPVVFLNHYPLDNGLDNWYEITDLLKTRNIIMALCGHGHANRAMNFEDIPAVMGRSNLRAKAPVGGYNLVDITADSAVFHERRPQTATLPAWTGIKIKTRQFDTTRSFPRPSYAMNEQYKFVQPVWTVRSNANVISTPAVAENLVIAGNQQGVVEAFHIKNGKKQWQFKTGASIFSSPAVSGNKIVLGSADGFVYCLRAKNGKLSWKLNTGAPVLGSPVIENGVVYIGGSNGIRAIDLETGKERWAFAGISGPVVSTPLLYEGKLIVGAWDTYLYALDKNTGALAWKWSNGSAVRNFSPASCTPVGANGLVYVVAPDRYTTAIDATTGVTAWRSRESGVRESIGRSENGQLIYCKTMNDTLTAFSTSEGSQAIAWKMYCGFGYDHVPSMPVEKEGLVYFGTRSGVVYCIDPDAQKIVWTHKLDNSMVNTVQVLSRHSVVVSTMDGKISVLKME